MTDPAPSAGVDKTSTSEQGEIPTSPADSSPSALDRAVKSESESNDGSRPPEGGNDGAGDTTEGDTDDAEEDEDEEDDGEEDEDEEDDDDDEEPRLKYARLTQHLGGVYRNADATSSFLVSGDKMV